MSKCVRDLPLKYIFRANDEMNAALDSGLVSHRLQIIIKFVIIGIEGGTRTCHIYVLLGVVIHRRWKPGFRVI